MTEILYKTGNFTEKIEQLDPGELVRERYEILSVLGEGGFGKVYSAFDRILKKEVALKFLSRDVIDSEKKFIRVKREINISQKITDPGIVKIFSLEEWKGSFFLVMERVFGRTLKDILEEKKKLKWENFKDIFLKIIEAIEVLHSNGIVHRDMKPSNIMIGANGDIKLLDFGLSKEVNDLEKTSSLGEIVGSPYYMSPEQVSMNDVGHRSDIYQLGLILYESLSGNVPFSDQSSTLDILYRRLSEEPRSVSLEGVKVPKFVEHGIMKALERDERDRFTSAEVMKEYFKEGKYPFMGKSLRRIRKHPVIASLLVLIIAGVFFSAFLFRKGSLETGKMEFKDSKLSVYNGLGNKLFEKDFYPSTVLNAVTHRISKNFIILNNRTFRGNQLSTDENVIAVFLTKKDLYRDIVEESLVSPRYASSLSIVDRKGKILFKEFFHLNFKQFQKEIYSGWMNFQRIRKRDVDGDGDKELLFETCHNMSMFPAQFVLMDDLSFYNLYNPGHLNWVKPVLEKGKYRFYIFGENNLMCHMFFLADVDLKKYGRIQFIPNLTEQTNSIKLSYFYYILPGNLLLVQDRWKEKGEMVFNNLADNSVITVKNNYTLIVKKGSQKKVFKDEFKVVFEAYSMIQRVYRNKIVVKDFPGAYRILNSFDVSRIRSPYLLSVFYFYKGDLEVLMGDLEKGKNSLKKSLNYFKGNNDAIQKMYEISFLKGKPKREKFDERRVAEKNIKFYGLGENGVKLFSVYTSLQEGKFRHAEKIISSMHREKTVLKSVIDIFRGRYSDGYQLMKELNGKITTPFTLEESRLMFSRLVLLSYLFSPKDKKPAKKDLDLSRFYFKDIADNMFLYSNLAEISASWSLVGREQRDDLADFSKEKFDELIKRAKGDVASKLWLFYDSFIYGLTMEKLENKIESVRGYEMCIKSNPHTDLAKRAKRKLEKLRL